MLNDLNTLVTFQKTKEIQMLFDGGYSLKNSDAWNFILSCSHGYIEIVELFLKHPHFKNFLFNKKNNSIDFKKPILNNDSNCPVAWYEAYLFSVTNSHLHVFKHLQKDPIFSKLGDPCDLIVSSMCDFVKEQNHDVIHYLMTDLHLYKNKKFFTYYSLLEQDKKAILDKYILYNNLEKLPINNTKSPLIKI